MKSFYGISPRIDRVSSFNAFNEHINHRYDNHASAPFPHSPSKDEAFL